MAKILVIEDSDDIREMVAIVLRSYGYDVSGILAKENINSVITDLDPQVVLLDVWVGNKYDKGLCKLIKSCFQNLPVILMSNDGGLLAEYIQLGADDFIEKPFDIMELKDKIDRLIK